MQAINNLPPAALPAQRQPDPAALANQDFEQSRGNAGQQQLEADINNQQQGGATDSGGLQRAEVSSRDRVAAVAPEAAQEGAQNASPRPQSADTVVQQARQILEQFDVGNMTSDELNELRATLEPLGVGRPGRNLVDMAV